MTDTNVPATSVTADAGRRTQATNGSCQNRQRGRGRGGQGHTPTRETAKETSNFKGNTAGMKGHVFQVFSKLSDPNEFERTIEVMGEYTAKTCKRAADVVGLFKSFEVPEIPPPKVFNRVNNTSTLAYAIWTKEVDAYVNRMGHQEDSLKAIYAVAWGQCSEAMKAKLKSGSNFGPMKL